MADQRPINYRRANFGPTGALVADIRRVCRTENFFLHHEFPEVFYTPYYKIPMPVYILYKACLTSYTLAIVILQLNADRKRTPWIYLTNWSYMLQCISLMFSTGISMWKALHNHCKRPDQREIPETFAPMTWYLKLKWVLQNITTTVPYLVTMAYWTLLWPSEQEKLRIPGFLHLTIQVHGINMVIAIVDMIMDRSPLRIHHFYHPISFLAIYSIFTLIYSEFDNIPIYPYLDWNNKFGKSFFFCILIFLLFLIFYFIAWVFKRIQHKYACNNIENPVEEHPPGDQTPLLSSFDS